MKITARGESYDVPEELAPNGPTGMEIVAIVRQFGVPYQDVMAQLLAPEDRPPVVAGVDSQVATLVLFWLAAKRVDPSLTLEGVLEEYRPGELEIVAEPGEVTDKPRRGRARPTAGDSQIPAST